MVETYSEIDLAEFIDHSLLTPVATAEQVRQWCLEAEQFNFPAVCLNPVYVRQAAELLHRKPTQVCTVIGYPSGATTPATKLYEAQEAVEAGAAELDVMLNLGWLKSGQTDESYRELAEICQAVGIPVKAVLETYLLTDSEKQLAVEISIDAGASFIQTNTGWGGPATVADVRLLKSVAKDQIQIKAAAGIQSFSQAIELILAGATRLGTSRGPDLVRQRDTLEEAAI
ncbi:MAG: deoxyribose-phosphate aldolase [Elainella sp.]